VTLTLQVLVGLYLVKEDTLLDMVNTMTEKVGLVHQMPYVCDRAGFPAILEKVSFFFKGLRIIIVYIFL